MAKSAPAAWGELAGLLEVRPLSSPLPAPDHPGQFSSPFTAPFASTLKLLRAEVKHLCPDRVILEADFRETDLRQDGMPRADRSARSPGLVLTLVGTPHGDLRYPCHRFYRWPENLRAIALALEALRKVDRYGVTKRGEQYAGWKALPAPDAPDVQNGRAIIKALGGPAVALQATHPDTRAAFAERNHLGVGYTDDDFRDVQAARDAS